MPLGKDIRSMCMSLFNKPPTSTTSLITREPLEKAFFEW